MCEPIVTHSDVELEAMGFDGLVSILRAAGLRDVELLEDHGYPCIHQGSISVHCGSLTVICRDAGPAAYWLSEPLDYRNVFETPLPVIY